MKRRDFLQQSTLAGLGLHAFDSQERSTASGEIKDAVLALIQAERRIEPVLAQQILDPNHRQAGGFVSPAYGFAYPASTAGELKNLGALYCHQRSRFYQQADLAKRISLGLGFLEREQHEDGTIDLPTTNFHSPPDTAFVVEDLVLLYRLISRESSSPVSDWKPRLERFLRRAAQAIATGGVHTPNHRWVACAALAGCYALFKDPLYLRRIDAWLAEGIDCNEDGEYTELSNAVYNPVTNRALILMAEALNRPELLEPVRRNLLMMLYCMHPDGEIVTDYSRRQDKLTRARAGNYYLHYRVMSVKDRDGRMATMADRIAADAVRRPSEVSIAGELPELMLRPELQNEKAPRAPLPEDYTRFFNKSGVMRIRRRELSATIVSKSSRFLSMRHGPTVLEAVRVAGAFFGKGQFLSPVIRNEGKSYVLRQELEAWYNQPLPAGAGIPEIDWDQMDHRTRERSHLCRMSTEIRLTEIDHGFEMTVTAKGTDRVPMVIEFWFRPGGQLTTATGGELVTANGSTFLATGTAEYVVGRSKISIGPGRAEHRWAQLRGAEAPIAEAVPLTIAGFTPFTHQLRIVATP